MAKGFGSDLHKNLQKVRFNQHGGLEAPVKANGKDGIVVGDPAFSASPAKKEARPGFFSRVRTLLRSR